MTKAAEPAEKEPLLYLKQVRIQQHAPILNAKVDFKPGLNIIIGPNGAGKTRFVILAGQSARTDIFPTEDSLNCELLFNYQQDIEVSFNTNDVVGGTPFNPHLNAIGLMNVREGRFVYPEFRYGGKLYSDKNCFTLSSAFPTFGIDHRRHAVITAEYGSPLRHMPLADDAVSLIFSPHKSMRLESEVSNETLDSVTRTLLTGAILMHLRKAYDARGWHQPEVKSRHIFPADEARELINRVAEQHLGALQPYLATYSAIEDIRLESYFQVYENTATQETIVKGLVLSYCIDGNWLPLSALSDGTKRLLYLITQLVSPAAQPGPNPLAPFTLFEPSKIIFLEEPELGIHPSQLHKLLSLIREVSREHQVIMTTHSPQVLDMLSEKELDRITICELDPKKGTQFHKLSATKKKQARAYMREELHLSDFWLHSDLENEA